jgi:protein transport protein SEC61 subunit alpha
VNLFVCASIAETVLGGFFRPSLLDVARMVTTLALLAAVAYAVGCGTRFQLKYRQVPTGTSLPPPPQYPIRLLYSLHMPLLIAAALLAHVALATHVLYRLWPGNPLAAITGTWELSTPEAPASFPTGGLAYWLSPPASTWEALCNPFRTLFYGTFLFAACTMAAEAWAASAGPAAREEARKIDEKGLTMQGCTTRTDIAKRLSAAITASIPLGGAALAILAIAGDVLGVIGSGAFGAIAAGYFACSVGRKGFASVAGGGLSGHPQGMRDAPSPVGFWAECTFSSCDLAVLPLACCYRSRCCRQLQSVALLPLTSPLLSAPPMSLLQAPPSC